MLDPDEQKRISAYPNVKVIANVSFLLSGWNCKFGDCPGILIHGAMTDVSCCQIGVHIEQGAEMDRMRNMARQLTSEDWDRADQINSGWYYKIPREDRESEYGVREPMFHTRVVDGGCIFANRHGGPAGKPGCAFHHLAARTGRHHSETKPDVCWQIPFAVTEDWDDEHWQRVITITGTPAATWGNPVMDDADQLSYPGYWCTETPDAYDGIRPVYQYAEVELRKLIGDEIYDQLAKELWSMTRRFGMPGELANNNRKMLPLLVTRRLDKWSQEGMHENVERSKRYVEDNLRLEK